MNKYNVIGLMSGTSLDGIDLAYCHFEEENGKWSFKVEKAETISYSEEWKKKLSEVETKSALEYAQTDVDFGHLLGKTIAGFIKKHQLNPDFIASHGHTIFHQPEKKLTTQIGNGAAIAAECGCTVISDFRTIDVALGGQGAPLVPIGDKLLFSDYDFCLNLGGFGNISFEENGKRIAFDTSPVNIVMNLLVKEIRLDYDKDGVLAASGEVNDELLNELNSLDFYQKPYPKSLGKEWVLSTFLPVLDKYNISLNDKLRTICEHVAFQIGEITKAQSGIKKMIITGGGAKNKFLIARIKKLSGVEVTIPDEITIDFKEALIFAFLGVLRMRNEPNCLKSVTGASHDNIGGAVYQGK